MGLSMTLNEKVLAILALQKVNTMDRLLLIYLARTELPDVRTPIGVMAEDLSVTYMTVFRSVGSLELHELITVERKSGFRTPSTISINWEKVCPQTI